MLLHELTTYQDQQLTLDKLQEVAREKGIRITVTAPVKRYFRHYEPLLEWGLKKIDSGSFYLGVSAYVRDLTINLVDLYLKKENYRPVMEDIKALQDYMREQKLTHIEVVVLDFLPTPLKKELQMFLSL